MSWTWHGGKYLHTYIGASNETKDGLFKSMRREMAKEHIKPEDVVAADITTLSTINTTIDHIPPEVFTMFPNLQELWFLVETAKEITSVDLLPAKNLTHLYFTSNKIRRLSAGTFEPMKLEYLKVDKNMIEIIEDFTFANLTSLQSLYLHRNKLTVIGREVFYGLSELLVLDLGENEIRTIEAGAFDDLGKVQRLDLNDNKLIVLNDHLFDGLGKLNTLLLNGNFLKAMNDESSIYTLASLKILHLYNNSISELNLMKFAKLPSLEKLKLNNNKINLENYNVSQVKLSFQSPLLYLNLAYNSLTTVASIEVLHIFPNLHELELHGNSKELDDWNVDPKNITFLPNLKYIV